LALQVGGVSDETAKYGRDFDTRVTALARPRTNCAVNYRPVLSSERVLQNNKNATSKRNFKEKEKLVAGPKWMPDTNTD
jgi:hypothetical protein